jgi:AcrR family transcriptional regulator
MTGASSVRDRRRADTVREIKEAALTQLAAAGTGGLSLRGVAREVGMTVQSMYHYFPSRQELLTALVADAHRALAENIRGAAHGSRDEARSVRVAAVVGAYRSWAHEHRARFLLIYGTPVPGYEAPPDGETTAAAQGLAEGFLDAVFGGWTPEELAGVPLPGGDLVALAALADGMPWGLPAGALALFLDFRARLHGMVMLEVLGQLHLPTDQADALVASMVARMTDELEAARSPRAG